MILGAIEKISKTTTTDNINIIYTQLSMPKSTVDLSIYKIRYCLVIFENKI